MSPAEYKLFLIKTNLAIHPTFYVSARDMIDAANKASIIVSYYGKEKVVESVSILNTRLLDLDKEE